MNRIKRQIQTIGIVIAVLSIMAPVAVRVYAADNEVGVRGRDVERGERRGPREGEFRGRNQGDLRGLLQELNLTDQQKEEIRPVLKEATEQRQAWHEANEDKIEGLRTQMRQAMKDRNREEVQSIRDQMKTLMDSAPKVVDAIKPFLTAEQTATLEQHIKERLEGRQEARSDRREQRMENRQDRPGSPNGPEAPIRRQTMQRILGQLDLTEEQKQQLREIHEQTREAMDAWRDANESKIEQLRDEMKTAIQNRDRETAESLRDEMKTLMDSAPNPKDEIQAVLTAEQNAKVEELIEKYRQQRQAGRGEGRPAPDDEDGDRPRRRRAPGDGEGRGRRGGDLE